MIHECQLDEHGRCIPCTARFDELLADIHTHECHKRTVAVRTPLGYRLIRFLRKFWRKVCK
jgi:hypothetical protein